jgi:hypothetical protein
MAAAAWFEADTFSILVTQSQCLRIASMVALWTPSFLENTLA